MGDSPGVFTPGVISLMQGYASSAYGLAQAAIGSLSSGVAATSLPATPALNITPPSPLSMPASTASAPAIVVSPAPPQLSEHEFPESPDTTVPEIPQLHEIIIPDFVDNLPARISTVVPSFTGGVPNADSINVDNVVYDSLFATLRNKLDSNIVSGGTLLDPVVEADIWNRDLERHEQALQDIIDKATGQWAKMGFSLPDGLLAGQLLAINNEYLNKRLDRSREISVKQAELEQTGLFKSLEMGVSFENIVMSAQNEFARRRLEAAKANADVMIAIFKERVNLYNSSLEEFKTRAEVYKTEISAELARAEVYKARISGIAAIVQLDEARVKAYSAQIAGLEALVNVYNTQIKAVVTLYEVEKAKIERFKAEIDAYAAQTDSNTKYYLGQIDAFKSEVQAYASQNASTDTNVESQARVAIAEYEAAIKLLEATARVEEVKAQVKMEGLKAAAQASSNLAAGAMSAIHANVSDAYQSTYQRIHSYQEK